MRNDAAGKTTRRNGLLAGVLAAGVAGLALTGGVVTNTLPVLAEPLTVETPQQSFGFADVVERVSPAVVSVRVKEAIQPAGTDGDTPNFDSPFGDLPDDHPLKRFFDFGPQGRDGMRGMRPHRGNPRPMMGQGSGFFISDDGFLVTNNHVVDGGTQYTVVMDDGTELDAKLIGKDKRTDLAVLKVEDGDRKFAYVEFADDSKVRIGDWVVAVGNPFGLGGSVTAGIISARGRDIGAGPYDDFIQIDAAVNRGNSGGPAFNLDGKVIGVNTAIFSPSGGNVGIAFAIPATTAKSVVQKLRNDGNVERGWLGVQIAPVTRDIAEAVGLDTAEGAIVTLPDTETPASKGGIATGDVITAVDGKSVEGPRELARIIAAYEPDTKIEVTLWRNEKEEKLAVTLGNLASLDEAASLDENKRSAPSVDPSSLSGYGLTLTPSEDGAGVVVTDVDPSSSAADKGVEAGDVIISVNGDEVKSGSDVEKALEKATKADKKAALFQIRNGDQNRFVALPLAKS